MECGREIKNDLSCIRKGWQRRRRHPGKAVSDHHRGGENRLCGDEVLVAPGVYREYVNPVNGGTGEDARIIYRSEVPLRR